MKKIILIFIVIGYMSCKNEQPNNDMEDNIFKIILSAKILEDDKIELYYLGDVEDGSFNIEERIFKHIKGSKEFQAIELSLPKGIIPSKFRIDIGDNINKHETQVDINSIDLKLNGKNIYIDKTILDSFFQPNVYLERNKSGYLRRIIDGKYDPFILSMPVLNKKIEIEL